MPEYKTNTGSQPEGVPGLTQDLQEKLSSVFFGLYLAVSRAQATIDECFTLAGGDDQAQDAIESLGRATTHMETIIFPAIRRLRIRHDVPYKNSP